MTNRGLLIAAVALLGWPWVAAGLSTLFLNLGPRYETLAGAFWALVYMFGFLSTLAGVVTLGVLLLGLAAAYLRRRKGI